jgi:VanZ family protein
VCNFGIWILCVIAVLLIVYYAVIKKQHYLFTYIGIAATLALTLVLYRSFQLETVAEKVHFIEYGILGFLSARAMRRTAREFSVYIGALTISCAVGAIDEGIQWIVPGRVFAVMDIVVNAIGACLGLAIATIVLNSEGSE